MKRGLFRFSSTAIFSIAFSVWLASVPFSSPMAAEAAASEKDKYPYASLQAEAVTEVAQDMVRITLAAEVSNAEQTVVADTLTRHVDSAMKQLRGNDGIKVYSGNYQIWPMNDQDGRISNWRGRAEIVLESGDFPAVSKLAAEVADRMPIANLSFYVAPETRARHEAELMEEAAAAFQARAKALAAAFGYESYSIREVQLGGAGTMYRPETRRMMAMAADASAPSVPLEGGTERISLSVQGTVFLNSSKK